MTAVFVTDERTREVESSYCGDRRGKLRQVGRAQQIKAHPSDEAVEAFLHELPR